MSDWSSGLCGCFENVGICIKAYFCPCIVAGEIGEALGEGCCYHGFCSLMGPIGIYCGAQNRGKLREKYQIPVCLCFFITLVPRNSRKKPSYRIGARELCVENVKIVTDVLSEELDHMLAKCRSTQLPGNYKNRELRIKKHKWHDFPLSEDRY